MKLIRGISDNCHPFIKFSCYAAFILFVALAIYGLTEAPAVPVMLFLFGAAMLFTCIGLIYNLATGYYSRQKPQESNPTAAYEVSETTSTVQSDNDEATPEDYEISETNNTTEQ